MALEYFKNGYHCSQSILATYHKECGISLEQALKLGSCFGAGMRQGEACGAVTGALMVLGFLYGTTEATNKIKAHNACDEFIKRIKERNKTHICNDFLGCDMRTEEGKNYARKNNLFEQLCPMMVINSCEIIEEIINETELDITNRKI